MTESLLLAGAVGLTFAAAGFVKGIIGMGLPTVAMGLLGLMMAPAAAAAMLIVPSTVTNVWQLLAGARFGTLLRRLGTMMAGVVAGTAVGIEVLKGDAAGLAGGALGLVLALYGVVGLIGVRLAVGARAEPWASPLVGLVTGAIAGATGIFVIPAVPYLNGLGLKKEELIQALGLSFTVSTVALAAALALHDRFPLPTLGHSTLAVLPALAGMFIGQRVRERLSPAAFKRWFFVGLAALGFYMLWRAIG